MIYFPSFSIMRVNIHFHFLRYNIADGEGSSGRGDTGLRRKTIAAMEITSEHAETQGAHTGHGVEEGFFLDGVILQRADVTGRDKEFASFIKTDPADAGLALRNRAPVAAGKTADPPIGHLFIKLAFFRILSQHFR